MENTNFYESDARSKLAVPYWNAYYKSEEFKEYINKFYRRKPKNLQYEIIRDIPLNEQRLGIDVIIKTNDGKIVQIDEKIRRKSYVGWNTYPIETVSNSRGKDRGPAKEGWGYHIGTTITFVTTNDSTGEFLDRPIIFYINEKFVNEITRNPNKKYGFTVSTTDVGNGDSYPSVCLKVFKNDLVNYVPNADWEVGQNKL